MCECGCVSVCQASVCVTAGHAAGHVLEAHTHTPPQTKHTLPSTPNTVLMDPTTDAMVETLKTKTTFRSHLKILGFFSHA